MKIKSLQFFNQGNVSVVNAVVDGRLSEDIRKAAEKPEEYELDIKRKAKKRSLDANALMWVCLQQIAEAIRTDKWSIYLQMLKRYGKFTYIVVKPGVVEAVKAQWRECEEIGIVNINGQEGVQLLCYFGSSTYNSKEFSILLDGIISEMKEIGLETPEDEVMGEALKKWERTNENQEIYISKP